MQVTPERGGSSLLAVVAVIALATFVYIAVVVFTNPQKASTVTQGVDGEGTAVQMDKTGVEPDITALASMATNNDGAFTIVYGEHTIDIAIGEARATTHLEQPAEARDITFADERGNKATLTRTYLTNNAIWWDPQNSDVIEVDYERMYRYVTIPLAEDTGDPLRSVMEFHDAGLYMWIYGGLYYYDPATGTFGLDMDHAP